MTYKNIVFLQGEAAETCLDIIEDKGAAAGMKHLIETYFNAIDEPEETEQHPWGEGDRLHQDNDFVISWNRRVGYVGLTQLVTKKAAS